MSQENVDGLVPIKASVTSVFYSRPSPGEPPYVEVGGKVEEDTVVCLLEIMKCFRSVPAGVNGTVEKVLVESGDLVQKGDAVMLIRPE
jgi:acetyl-CoA carboxylase biotin carboxyl carrier protein